MGYKPQIAVHVPYFEAAIRSVQGTNLVATIPSKFIAGMAYNPSIKISKPPQLGGDEYGSDHGRVQSTPVNIAVTADGDPSRIRRLHVRITPTARLDANPLSN
jgi:hypothetical protein